MVRVADARSRSIDTLPNRRIVAQGKPSLIESVLSATPETLSATSPEKPGFGPRSIRKWLQFSAPPDRRATAPKTCSLSYFLDYCSRRWVEGCVRGRELLHEMKLRGYTGSFSHLERLLAKWRRARGAKS